VQAVAVGRGIHRNGFDAHFAAGTDHAQRNLATVGNQYFFKHKASI
jgi:hypothetical protein